MNHHLPYVSSETKNPNTIIKDQVFGFFVMLNLWRKAYYRRII